MQLFRANIAHFPTSTSHYSNDIVVIRDGGLLIDGKNIVATDTFDSLKKQYPLAQIHDYRDYWILPGLIDSHIHYPQTQSIASYGEQLLAWLENYTFPTERKFASIEHASAIAQVFLRQLLKNGTTTGFVFSSVHKDCCDALFSAASQIDMAIVAGKVCMDRNCPSDIQDTATSAQKDSAELIEKWHNKGRNRYAITPRFAPTSSEAQMAALGELASSFDDVFIQTHLSENMDEIAWVKSLYPNAKGYLDVYDHYHMVHPRAVFGHGIHLTEEEWQRINQANATLAFCPSSNLFLGSGLFDMNAARENNVHVALATDVGAGTSFNMMKTYADAYKVSQLRHSPIDPLEGFYLMTQGAGIAHQLDHEIGNLNSGTAADFIIVNPHFDELMRLRLAPQAEFSDVFFALSILGDDRAIEQTWISGQCCFNKKEADNALV